MNCPDMVLTAWAGGAATCRPWTYSIPHPDPLPPQGGASLARLFSGSSWCPPGWLCSGKYTFSRHDPGEKKLDLLFYLISYCCSNVYRIWILFHSSPSTQSCVVSTRCSLASWIPSYSCVPYQPVTLAQLTWLHTWSTLCMSWRPPWLCLSSLTRGWRCSSSRYWQLSTN